MELPAYLQTSLAPRLADRTIANLGAAAPPYVSIAGNRFTLIDSVGDEEPVTTLDPKTGMFYLDCVLIDSLEIESKIFYAKAYDPNAQGFAPPDCWSDNGIAPSRNAAPGRELGCGPTCAACQYAEWGSKVSRVSGKGVPACAKYQKLAVMLPGDEVQFLLRVPPNSLKNLREYLIKFNGQQFDMKDVITRISFVKEQLGTLVFSAVKIIDEPTAKQREAIYAKKGTDILVGRGDQPREGLPVPAQAARITHDPAPSTYGAGPAQGTVTQAQPMQQPANPTTLTEPTRRRRRTAAQIAADEAGAAPGPTQAPFRETAQPNGGQAPHGIQAGVAPNPELMAALDSVFGS